MKLKCSQTHLKCQYRELLNLRFFITHYTVFRHASTIDAEPQWLEASSWARPTSHCHPAWGSLSKVSRIPGRCPVFLKDQEREMVKQKIHDLHQHTSTATSVQQKPICGRPNRKKKHIQTYLFCLNQILDTDEGSLVVQHSSLLALPEVFFNFKHCKITWT